MSFREERAAERKLNIIRTAARLFSEKGYHEATVEDIAKELKYTKGSIYYYIQSKQDLLFECHDLAMNMLMASIDKIKESGLAPDLMLKEVIKGHVEIMVGELNLINVSLASDFLLQDEYAEIIVKKRDLYEESIKKIIVEGIKQGIFKPVPEKMVIFLIMGAINWISRWFSEKGPLSKEEIAQFYADYLLAPLMLKQ
ncbi:transcriptional regulator [Desulfocucumis palustris]|uniref:Transcriptional regulator n=1 Tax=Desulfocucumis palustris TaxID=1898651 RepID=A0A2L2XFL5_9FIRM|nr:TetR/AcrR family transcriptional regulator [Desulfocucumis palustris]GBF35127.1 transcriptional regulator [Desulfocucumis palustris]